MKGLFKHSILVFTLSALALVLIACSPGTPELEPVSFQIDMTEYAFDPPSIELQVGQQATLELTNSGQLDHEIMFGREVMTEENRPAGYMEDLFETANVTPQVTSDDQLPPEEDEHGFMVILPPGGTATISFPVTEAMVGEWEMGCFEQDGVHYDAGMHGPLTIQP
jgi:uncharacterized cupredoxin-like copper-binding protein